MKSLWFCLVQTQLAIVACSQADIMALSMRTICTIAEVVAKTKTAFTIKVALIRVRRRSAICALSQGKVDET